MEAETRRQSAVDVRLRVMKVLQPIVPRPDAGIELPELREGSIIPRVHPVSKEVKDHSVFRAPDHPARLLASLPELPEE